MGFAYIINDGNSEKWEINEKLKLTTVQIFPKRRFLKRKLSKKGKSSKKSEKVNKKYSKISFYRN